MATGGDVDLGELSPSQQDALQQYMQVTDQEVKDAIPLLQRSQWNVQIAIAKFFDGEGPDPLAEALAQQELPRSSARLENLQESMYTAAAQPPRRNPADRPEPAPRIVPMPNTVHRPPFLVGLLLTPFSLGWAVASLLFRTVWYIFSFLPASIRPRGLTNGSTPGLRNTTGRRMLMPQDTAARFKREFEEEYGNSELPWFEGGIAQAQDLAKKDLKFLWVVLMSPEHDDTESFTRETLLAPEVIGFIRDPANNIILWGGNILDSEAYQVAQEYNCTKYPFSALVCLTPKEGSTRMSIVKRLVGAMPPTAYLSEAQSAINKYTADLAGAAAATRLAAQRDQWRRWRATRIEAEPAADDKEVVRIALKMPESSGAGRIVRRFRKDTSLEALYAFVECYDLLQGEFDEKAEEPTDYKHKFGFSIASIMPRVVYEASEDTTMGEKIGRSGNLIVEDVTPHADESDGES
ncbi:hypothetical protein VdG1_05083 [Verticillium dahliae VDG1]|nr:hypothetical protein VdG1_05083 [Verticillium dahliae VDG1]